MTQEVYAQKWHRGFTPTSQHAAAKILPFLFNVFEPKSYIELGSGFAQWCQQSIELGVTDSLAIDGPWTDLQALHIDQSKFLVKDLGAPVELGRRFDIALTLEVAEHINAESARIFVDNLIRHSDLIVFGAAIPLQGGYRHVNEQWQSYWKDLFAEKHYVVFDIVRPHFWKDQSIPYYYRQNTLVYIKSDRSDLIGRAEDVELPSGNLIDIVHPEKYTEMVTYESVNVPRMLRKMPWHTARYIARSVVAGIRART